MDKNKWNNAKTLELEYHKNCEFRKNDLMWNSETKKLIEGLGIDLNISGKNILDIGCGSKLRTIHLIDKNMVIGIDPLAEEYKKLPFSNLNKIKVFSSKAEECVDELINKFDICLCLNVLDHCENPEIVIKRIYQYLKNNGLLYLWTDIGHNDSIHDGLMTVENLEKTIKSEGFIIKRMTSDIDPYNFSKTDVKDYYRCGTKCDEKVTCVVVYAEKQIKN